MTATQSSPSCPPPSCSKNQSNPEHLKLKHDEVKRVSLTSIPDLAAATGKYVFYKPTVSFSLLGLEVGLKRGGLHLDRGLEVMSEEWNKMTFFCDR